ncbi:AbfB domain-containing protein [Actinoplanes sp. NPDC020271]|uniref:AbfB domain-containing protein n=1 Tax=Actinoplanes sp. NPDC020271 TaxID=3363896 RepID=UPI00378C4526
MTIYGQGGVNARDSRRLHPGVLALVAAATVAVVAAGVYFVMRSPSPPSTPTPVAAASSAPVASSPAAAPSRTAPGGLATGSWLVSPAGDKESYLTVKGEFATFSEVAEPLTIVAGLADDSCFTFRDGDGKYLRHFNYRLRFDAKDDSDLFRKDATFCAEDDQPAGSFRVRSINYPDYFLHRRDADLYIDKPSGDSFEADSTFTLQAPAVS